MESILLDFPIPEIYLSYQTDAEGYQEISVVDGQQRLTALLKFLEDEYPLQGVSETLGSGYEGKYFSQLSDEDRTDFFQYRFPIRQLLNLDEDSIREIFARVNQVNVALNSQEIRNALLPGPFLDFLKDCVESDLTQKSSLFSPNRRARGGDLEFYAEVFGAINFGIVAKKDDFDARYDQLSVEFSQFEVSASEFLGLLNNLAALVRWNRTRWSNIVDMYALLIASWSFRNEIGTDNNVDLSVGELLDLFQQAVNGFKNSRGEEYERAVSQISDLLLVEVKTVSEKIEVYAAGIRNSSDLGSRRKRVSAVQWLLTSYFSSLSH